jgi:hypothetical protein
MAVPAVLALAILAAGATAATLPEFKPVPTKKKFTATGKSVEWKSGVTDMFCEAATTGEITGARTVGKVKITWTDCTTDGSRGAGCKVNSVGAKEGEIVFSTLDGELGTTTEAGATGVVILLKPESGKNLTTLVSNECTGEAKVSGDPVVEVATIGKKQTTNTFSFVAKYVENIKLDSGEIGEGGDLTGWLSSSLLLEGKNEVKFEEALEVS